MCWICLPVPVSLGLKRSAAEPGAVCLLTRIKGLAMWFVRICVQPVWQEKPVLLKHRLSTVSYTHLDVYKRQALWSA